MALLEKVVEAAWTVGKRAGLELLKSSLVPAHPRRKDKDAPRVGHPGVCDSMRRKDAVSGALEAASSSRW
jgi:hypothetical protein